MTARLLTVVTLVLQAKPAEEDVKKLEGTWLALSATVDGKPLDNGGKASQFVFAGNRLTIKELPAQPRRFHDAALAPDPV